MSIFGKIGSALRGVARTVAPAVATMYGGPMAGAAVGAILARSAPTAPSPLSLPPAALPGGAPMGIAPIIPAVGAAVGRAVLPSLGMGLAGGLAIRGVAAARGVARSAWSYCRKHPAWCASIGGLAAVEALVSSGQLPMVKRRRRRGITPSDLSKFKRVAGFLHKWGPMCAGAKRPRRC